MASSPAVAATSFSFPAFSPGNAKQAVLAHLAETPRLARVTAASHLEIRPAPETVSTGIAELDALTGGLPRGCLTEITGPASSGRTSVLLAALAAATRRGEVCALIDAGDAFDPRSAAAAGIDLTRLLWVRCTAPSGRSKPHVLSEALDRKNCHPERCEANAERVEGPASGTKRNPARHAQPSRAAREPRASRQQRESRDSYVTAPTYRGAPEPHGVRNLFHLPSAPRAPQKISQPDLFSGENSHPGGKRNPREDWKRRKMEDPVEQALRATDLLLQSGGFGMVVIDLADIPMKTARRIPLTTWFRFRRVIEPTPTVLLLVGEHPCAQTCATLGLRMEGQDESSVMDQSSVVGDRSSAKQSLVEGSQPALGSQLSAFSFQASTFASAFPTGDSQSPPFPTVCHPARSEELAALNTRNIGCHPERSEPPGERSEELVLSLPKGPAFPGTGNDDGAQSSVSGHGFSRADQPSLKDAGFCPCRPTLSNLLVGLPLRAELQRARSERKPAQSLTTFRTRAAWTG